MFNGEVNGGYYDPKFHFQRLFKQGITKLQRSLFEDNPLQFHPKIKRPKLLFPGQMSQNKNTER